MGEYKFFLDHTFKAIISTVIGVVLSPFLVLMYRKFPISSCRMIMGPDEKKTKNHNDNIKYYISNDYSVSENKNQYIGIPIVSFFIKSIFKENNKRPYFIVAPTGTGKSTFIVNLYYEYSKLKYRFSISNPSLLVGRIYDSELWDQVDKLIEKNKAKDTVLVLDALDELSIQPYHKLQPNLIQNYWTYFYKMWEENYSSKIKKFKKVIITVREQFIVGEAFEQFSLNNLRFNLIQLYPFSTKQQDNYLKNRFGDKALIIDVANILRNKFPEITKLPLVLSYMDRIASLYPKTTEENAFFFSRYNVYNIMVNEWLKREASEKELTNEEALRIKEFCKKLALNFSQEKDGFPIEEINTLENGHHLLSLLNLQDRSLLIKSGKDKLKFAHPNIHDFFLALYFSEELRGTKEVKFEFEKNLFVLAIVIEKKLLENKSDFLRICMSFNEKIQMPVRDLATGKKSHMDVYTHDIDKKVQDFGDFFINLLPSRSMRIAFYNNSQEILKDISFLSNIRINALGHDRLYTLSEGCFYQDGDYTKKIFMRDNPIIFFSFFKNQTNTIIVMNVPIKDEDLFFLNGSTSITSICLAHTLISGKCWDYFVNSIKAITSLTLVDCPIDEGSLEKFSSAKLISLTIDNCQLSGDFLKFFKNSRNSLKSLWINNMRIQNAYVSDILNFKHLDSVDIRNCGIDNHPAIDELKMRGVRIIYSE